MTTLVRQPVERLPVVPDRRIRGELRRQIAHLEADLPPGYADVGARPRGAGGAAIQTVEQLERIRDDLVRLTRERRFPGGEDQERARRLREEMLLDPAAHRGVSVTNEQMGEPGCTRWTNWFRLVVSGGCP